MGTEVPSTAPYPSILKAKDGSLWRVCDANVAQGTAFIVFLGWFNAYFPGHTPAHIEHAPKKIPRALVCILEYGYEMQALSDWVGGTQFLCRP